jgi:hypothetical protein
MESMGGMRRPKAGGPKRRNRSPTRLANTDDYQRSTIRQYSPRDVHGAHFHCDGGALKASKLE